MKPTNIIVELEPEQKRELERTGSVNLENITGYRSLSDYMADENAYYGDLDD